MSGVEQQNIALPQKSGKDTRFTDEQWRAIHQEGTNILVSASAGSGKTTVLTRRIIEKVKKGVNVNELIVVTFTEAATREMRSRIQHALELEVKVTEDVTQKDFLQKQLTLLPQANISTIHSFCSKLIKEHFQMVHVDPNFKLLNDNTEIRLMKEAVFADLKEELYDDESFKQLVKSYATKEKDDNVTQLVLSLYEFSRAKENPTEWLQSLSHLYDVSELSSSQLYVELIIPYAKQLIEGCRLTMNYIDTLLFDMPNDDKSYQLLKEEAAVYETLYDLIDKCSAYDVIKQVVDSVSYQTLRFSKDVKEIVDSQAIKQLRDEAKKQFNLLKNTLFFASEQKQVALLQLTCQNVKTLAQVVIQFQERYQLEKSQYNMLDYNDLEHFALDVLAPLQKDGSRKLSAVAQYYQSHLNEIMVDEYQDVNRLQDGILTRLSNGHNMFMVGDVKQSIYAFRLADPSLFQEKYDKYKYQDGGVRILLKENFRSRANVLNVTNYIFMQLMDRQLGQMIYDDDAMMVQGNVHAYSNEHDVDVSMLIYEGEVSDDDLEQETLGKIDGEMEMVAHKIKQLMQQKPLITIGYDDNEKNYIQRELTYSDIAILTPTKKNNLKIKSIFERYHIPIVIQEADTFFKRTEIMMMMSLLRVIDNPYQDIPLVATLRSPIVNVGENELAAIRINERTDNYYNAVKKFVADFRQEKVSHTAFHTNLYNKLDTFLNQLYQWRMLAAKESIATLIWQIYTDTLFLDFVSGLSNATQRQANLHGLYEHAKSFEQTRLKGLFQFVLYIEKMQEKENDLAEPTTMSQHQDAVSLMTIHSSKGLEFSYVFVCDLTKQFNMKDIEGHYIFEEEYGIGTYYFDTIDKWQYPTLALEGIKQYKKYKLYAEEMRKLYVALTRAKEKLFLVGSDKTKETFLTKIASIMSHQDIVLPLSSRAKGRIRAFDWVTLALARHNSITTICQTTPYIPEQLKVQSLQLSYEFYTQDDFSDVLANQIVEYDDWLEQNSLTKPNTAIYEKLYHNVTQTYGKGVDTKTTSYQAVSELKRLSEDPTIIELVTQPTNTIYRYVNDGFDLPQFVQPKGKVTPARVGTATHLVMQSLQLAEDMTLQHIEMTIQQLVNKQMIDEQVAKKIDVLSILRFFQTAFGQFLMAHHQQIKTEVPLSLLVPAKQLFKEVTDEQANILVHGIVDGYVELEDSIIIYDYKTDNVKRHGVEPLVKKYNIQLDIYAKALSSALNKPVSKAVLCFLQTGDNVAVIE